MTKLQLTKEVRNKVTLDQVKTALLKYEYSSHRRISIIEKFHKVMTRPEHQKISLTDADEWRKEMSSLLGYLIEDLTHIVDKPGHVVGYFLGAYDNEMRQFTTEKVEQEKSEESPQDSDMPLWLEGKICDINKRFVKSSSAGLVVVKRIQKHHLRCYRTTVSIHHPGADNKTIEAEHSSPQEVSAFLDQLEFSAPDSDMPLWLIEKVDHMNHWFATHDMQTTVAIKYDENGHMYRYRTTFTTLEWISGVKHNETSTHSHLSPEEVLQFLEKVRRNTCLKSNIPSEPVSIVDACPLVDTNGTTGISYGGLRSDEVDRNEDFEKRLQALEEKFAQYTQHLKTPQGAISQDFNKALDL